MFVIRFFICFTKTNYDFCCSSESSLEETLVLKLVMKTKLSINLTKLLKVSERVLGTYSENGKVYQTR